jgi:hypothetical protein
MDASSAVPTGEIWNGISGLGTGFGGDQQTPSFARCRIADLGPSRGVTISPNTSKNMDLHLHPDTNTARQRARLCTAVQLISACAAMARSPIPFRQVTRLHVPPEKFQPLLGRFSYHWKGQRLGLSTFSICPKSKQIAIPLRYLFLTCCGTFPPSR